MKRILTVVASIAVILALSLTLCACFASGAEKAAKEADKGIEKKMSDEQTYSSALEYKEDEDRYYYTLTVDMGDSDRKPSDLVYSLKQNIGGYFSDVENITVVVKCYYGEVFHSEYVNWEYVEAK